MDKTALLKEIITSVVREAGMEIFSFKAVIYQGTVNIEILIDRPNGGISLNECAQINRVVRKRIEDDGLYGDDYTLSVASPGLDRPLESVRDFRRVIGQDIEVNYRNDERGTTALQKGRLKSVGEQDIILNCPEGEVVILLEHIHKAVIMI